ncbi:uracil-5--methyltransferase [Astrocystis sublimbata]|nr:uracil-5--methyltransferase [Astrocystis sublimbata]
MRPSSIPTLLQRACGGNASHARLSFRTRTNSRGPSLFTSHFTTITIRQGKKFKLTSYDTSADPTPKGNTAFTNFLTMADPTPTTPPRKTDKPTAHQNSNGKPRGKRPAPHNHNHNHNTNQHQNNNNSNQNDHRQNNNNNQQSALGKKRQQKKQRKRERDMQTGSAEEVLAFDVRDLRRALLNESASGSYSVEGELEEVEVEEPSFAEEVKSLPEPGTEILVKVVELSSTGEALAVQVGKTGTGKGEGGGEGEETTAGPASKRIYVLSFAVPGDIAKVKVYRHLHDEGYSVADFISVVTPSPQRDDSLISCQYFSKCSGCQFQMLSYATQLAHKKRIVEKAFANFSNLTPEVIPTVGETIGSPLQYGYRTKLTPHFDGPPGSGRRGKNKAVMFAAMPDIGFMLKGTRKTMDIEDCPIGTEAVRLGMKAERERMEVEFGKYKKGATILLRESTQRVTSDSNTSADADADVDAEPDVSTSAKGVKVKVETPEAGHIDYKTCITNNNATSTEYVGDYVFHNPAGSFFQNNNSILPVFTDYIRQHVLPPSQQQQQDATTNNTNETMTTPPPKAPKPLKYLIDAYSGSGLFTITLSALFTSSTGIDIAESSITFARRNARSNNLPPTQAEFIAGDANSLFASVPSNYSPDETVVILDPPRKGCDADFLSQLLDFGPKRIVYVSCNVHTQARDVGVLVRGEPTGGFGRDDKEDGDMKKKVNEKGVRYEIESLRGFDFFPQTGHVEGVAVLNRVDDDNNKDNDNGDSLSEMIAIDAVDTVWKLVVE